MRGSNHGSETVRSVGTHHFFLPPAGGCVSSEKGEGGGVGVLSRWRGGRAEQEQLGAIASVV